MFTIREELIQCVRTLRDKKLSSQNQNSFAILFSLWTSVAVVTLFNSILCQFHGDVRINYAQKAVIDIKLVSQQAKVFRKIMNLQICTG